MNILHQTLAASREEDGCDRLLLKSQIRIAISGKSGSGKTELANHLASRLGIVRASTGDIYRSLSNLLVGEVRKEFMNALTKALRGMDPYCVVKAALRKADNPAGIIFDSMRFREDHCLFRALGFLLVRLNSPTELRLRRMRARGDVFDADLLEADASETELDGASFDLVLPNDGDDFPSFCDGACKQVTTTLNSHP